MCLPLILSDLFNEQNKAADGKSEAGAEEEEEEDDPLDAFMAGIDKEVKKQAATEGQVSGRSNGTALRNGPRLLNSTFSVLLSTGEEKADA